MKNMLENLFEIFNQFPGANSEIGKFITENTGKIEQGKSIKYISQKFMVDNSTSKQVENKTIRIGEESNDEKFDNMKAFLLLVAKTYRLVHLMEIKSKEDDVKKESNLK